MNGFFEMHYVGGMEWMVPITILLIINIGIAGYILYCRSNKKLLSKAVLESLKQLGGLAAAYGTLGTLTAFFMAFNALEQSKEIIGFQIIMGGLKVALMTIVYGMVVFCLSLAAYIVLKATSKTSYVI